MRQRQSHWELLRLISTGLIIAHHFSVHGGFYFTSPVVTGNMLFLQLLSIGGKVGVNLFVMLSAWFLTSETTLRKEKLGTLWAQIAFYSIVIYALACAFGLTRWTFSGQVKAMLPILSKQWWFASSYFFLYLLSPWLNRQLNRLNRKGHLRLILILSVFWFLVPVFVWLPERLRDLGWFLYLYLLTAYVRHYGSDSRKDRKFWLLAGLFLFGLTFALAAMGLAGRAGSAARYETVYFDAHHVLILAMSLCFFRFFSRLELPANPTINALASLSFGVYLIHDSDHLRYPIWRGLLRCADWMDAPLLWLYALGCIAGVYLVCGGLEGLRQRLFVWAAHRVKNHQP